MCSVGHAICTRSSIGNGVVRFSGKPPVLNCCTCLHNKHHCCHVDIVMEALKNDDEDMYDCLTPFLKEVQGETSTSSGQQYNCLSYKSIPFCLSRELGEKLGLPYSDRFNIESNTCQLFSDNTCQCCEPSANSTFSTKLKTAKIVLPNKLLNATGMCMMVIQYEIMFPFMCNTFMPAVHVGVCSGCGTSKQFDGQAYGLLNMGKFLVSYEVLRTFMHQFLLGR